MRQLEKYRNRRPDKKVTEAYPYQNQDMIDLPGERWKDIPRWEGYYRISNFGRVKRMEFEIQCSDGSIRLMKSRIKKPDLTLIRNKSVDDNIFFLRNKIVVEGVSYDFGIARMVYYCFIKKFDWEDYSYVVLAKDGNGKNIRPENLVLVHIRRKQQRIYEQNRSFRSVATSYEEYTKHGLITSTNLNCRQVSQYTAGGKRIGSFPSIKAASLVLGISAAGIASVLKGRQILSGGFGWQYGLKPRVDIKGLREKGKLHRKLLVGMKISQYNDRGKRVATYLSIADAGRATGIGHGDISLAISGGQKSAGGFIWKKGWGKAQIDLSGYVFGEAWRAERRWKKVKQYTLEGKYVRTLPSVKAAGAEFGIKPSAISTAIKKQRTSQGFRWKWG